MPSSPLVASWCCPPRYRYKLGPIRLMLNSVCPSSSAFVSLPPATSTISCQIASPACCSVMPPCSTSLTSTSILSFIRSYICLLPVILMTGTTAEPVGVPRPVVKQTRCTPPAAIPDTHSISLPGESIKYSPPCPSCGNASAYSITPFIGVVPPLLIQPRDFSSIVVSPPAILPGLGLPPRISSPMRVTSASKAATISYNRCFVGSSTARCASTCSAPIISVVSPITALPPLAIS